MVERESTELVVEVGSESSAHSSPAWHSGSWWSHRHFHVPVVVWLVASVLGGAAIGGAVEPDHKSNETPPTIEITSDQVDAAACDPTNDADPEDAVNRPSSFAADSSHDVDPNAIACD
jgi:hypothetical protein